MNNIQDFISDLLYKFRRGIYCGIQDPVPSCHPLLFVFLDGAYELAISYLSSTGDKCRNVPDESLLCQKVQNKLSAVSVKDADKFNECYQKVKNSVC